jgi:hypothetical protein
MNAIPDGHAIIATDAVVECGGYHYLPRIAPRGSARRRPAMREVAGGFRFREAVEVR